MVRAPLLAVLAAGLLVAWQEAGASDRYDDVPTVACVHGVFQTVEARIDHLVHVIERVERGADPRSLPAAPSDARLAACPS